MDVGFAQVKALLPGPGGACSEHWEGDRLVFNMAILGQTLSGVIDVQDASVTMQIELPGFLGVVASGLRNRLQSVGQLLLTRK